MAEPRIIRNAYFNPGSFCFSLYLIGGAPCAFHVKALLNMKSPSDLYFRKASAIQGDEMKFIRDNESSERIFQWMKTHQRKEQKMNYDYPYCKKAADFLKTKISFQPDVGIILGSGLGPLAKAIEEPVEIPYQDIPHFLLSTAPDQEGKMIFGKIRGKKVMCMSGRFHYYEGYDFEQLVLPVRVMALMGIKALSITHAAGGVNLSYQPGDVMVIKDQIKLMGASPLRGQNEEKFGPRFFDLSDLYTKKLRDLAKEVGKKAGFPLQEGVYFFMPGPQYESAAEIRAIRVLGGDAAGMSTVTEALTAAHLGLPLLGFSLITNTGTGISKNQLSSDEVKEMADQVADRFSSYMADLIEALSLPVC